MKNFIRRAMLLMVAAVVPMQAAYACPDGWSSTSLGFCAPNYSGPGAAEAEAARREAQAQIVGPQIAAWFQGSRQTALATSSPIPFNVRRALTGFVPENVLNTARYKVGDHGLFNAAGTILGVNNKIAAVALVDVIVFRHASDASGNYKLWAHELKHVRQFMDWGPRDFGIRYARSVDSVEDPANEEAARYTAWDRNRQQSPQTQNAPQQWPQPVTATVCVTPYMSCQMAAIGPAGQSCYCPTAYGPLWGQAR